MCLLEVGEVEGDQVLVSRPSMEGEGGGEGEVSAIVHVSQGEDGQAVRPTVREERVRRRRRCRHSRQRRRRSLGRSSFTSFFFSFSHLALFCLIRQSADGWPGLGYAD